MAGFKAVADATATLRSDKMAVDRILSVKMTGMRTSVSCLISLIEFYSERYVVGGVSLA